MSELIMVLGPAGHGKSTSIRALNPENTYIINCMGKRLPFPDAKKYKEDPSKIGLKGNICATGNPTAILKICENISEKRPDIKNLIIDDLSYVMVQTYVSSRNEKDQWEKFNRIAYFIWDLLQGANQLREGLNVIVISHLDSDGKDTVVGGAQLGMKTVGKFTRDKINPEGLSTIILVPIIERKGGQATYFYITQADRLNPARSPIDMFPYEIPCDLGVVVDRLAEYENEIPLSESKVNFELS